MPITHHGRVFDGPGGLHWKITVDGMLRLSCAERILVQGERLPHARWLNDLPVIAIHNTRLDRRLGSHGKKGIQFKLEPKSSSVAS